MTDFKSDNFQGFLNALPCYIAVLDRTLDVVWSNDSSKRDFGSHEGKKCYQLFQTDHARCTNCPAKAAFDYGQVNSREMTFTTLDGSKPVLLVHATPLKNEKNEIDHVIEMAVNITSVKEMQRQLILLGQTFAGMAHSIKNIMMGLEGGIYVVNRGLEDKKQDEVREGWEMVLLNFDKISRIVKDILYCSKDRVPDFQPVSPNEIIQQIYGLFKDVAKKYSVSIKLDLDPDLKEVVLDPIGLHNVLSNLVSNAIDACKMDMWKDEHIIEVRSRRRKDGDAVIEVADNGVGIDKDVREHIFEEFFSSKGDQGTGLGLMVTQKIMRENGGRITFRSRPHQGTTFVVTFPARELN
jgi:signal transduction histidine kinase